jgi:hypothetical protein
MQYIYSYALVFIASTMYILCLVYTLGMNQTVIEEKIAELKALIDEARNNGFHNIADMWARELQTTIAMAKIDGRMR